MAAPSLDDLPASFELYLRASNKSRRTIETYREALDGFTALVFRLRVLIPKNARRFGEEMPAAVNVERVLHSIQNTRVACHDISDRIHGCPAVVVVIPRVGIASFEPKQGSDLGIEHNCTVVPLVVPGNALERRECVARSQHVRLLADDKRVPDPDLNPRAERMRKPGVEYVRVIPLIGAAADRIIEVLT